MFGMFSKNNNNEEECLECEGSGYIDCPLEYGDDRHPEQCPACSGKNRIVCRICHGTGKVKIN